MGIVKFVLFWHCECCPGALDSHHLHHGDCPDEDEEEADSKSEDAEGWDRLRGFERLMHRLALSCSDRKVLLVCPEDAPDESSTTEMDSAITKSTYANQGRKKALCRAVAWLFCCHV